MRVMFASLMLANTPLFPPQPATFPATRLEEKHYKVHVYIQRCYLSGRQSQAACHALSRQPCCHARQWQRALSL